MKRTFYLLLAQFCTLVIFAGNALAQGCPMCRESVANASDQISKGFNYSILAMVFLPTTLVSGVSLFVLRASYYKKHPGTTLSTFGIVRESLKEWRESRNA